MVRLMYRSKKIICGDHLIGVYRYLGCSEGEKRHRASDQEPHEQYDCFVDGEYIHRIKKSVCQTIRNDIQELMWPTKMEPHDYKTCRCDRGEKATNWRRN